MLVVAVLALLLVPVVQLLGSGLQGLHGLEPFLDMVVVLIGLLAVAVSLHMLDDTQQGRANVLVAGLATAAVCNFLHAVLLHQMESMASVTRANVSSYFGLLAHGVEALTLLLFALRVSFHGPGRAWAVASAGVSLVLVWSASSGLPEQFGLAHGERFAMGADALLGGVMAVAAWVMYRVHDTAGRERGRGRRRIMACAAAALALAEFAMLLYPLHPVFVDTFAHALRVLGYALMFQAVFIAGIRMPFARAREAEARLLESERRLQLLGRNLPDSVLYQRVREADGRWHFVHMGDAIERLNGISAQAVVNDATLFFEQMEPQDRLACAASDEASYRTMGVGDSVVRMRVANGQLRWMRMSSTPGRWTRAA